MQRVVSSVRRRVGVRLIKLSCEKRGRKWKKTNRRGILSYRGLVEYQISLSIILLNKIHISPMIGDFFQLLMWVSLSKWILTYPILFICFGYCYITVIVFIWSISFILCSMLSLQQWKGLEILKGRDYLEEVGSCDRPWKVRPLPVFVPLSVSFSFPPWIK